VAVTATIDAAFKVRVRDVLEGRPVTEAELRKLIEEGRACSLIMEGQLAKGERRLEELAGDPDSSIADVAAVMRRVNVLRLDVAELNELLVELDDWARKHRTAWLSA
jgi:hypothetical protein